MSLENFLLRFLLFVFLCSFLIVCFCFSCFCFLASFCFNFLIRVFEEKRNEDTLLFICVSGLEIRNLFRTLLFHFFHAHVLTRLDYYFRTKIIVIAKALRVSIVKHTVDSNATILSRLQFKFTCFAALRRLFAL